MDTYTGVLIQPSGKLSIKTLQQFRAENLEPDATMDGSVLHYPILGGIMGKELTLFTDDLFLIKRMPYNAFATLLYRQCSGKNEGIILGPALLVDDEHIFTEEDARCIEREYSAAARILSASTMRNFD